MAIIGKMPARETLKQIGGLWEEKSSDWIHRKEYKSRSGNNVLNCGRKKEKKSSSSR
jgi:hypothetical protein